MPLKAGTRFGSFEVLAKLGAGGMGEVWRVKDTRLQREVAIKILPEDFASDPERISRFHREAQALASLNHPNIAAIHDLQEIEGSRCIVLELVQGETLGERIRRGSIPLEESLQIAKQVCDALEAAHEKGIIHRDLKPDNIKVTPEGVAKVLDFGLAKVFVESPDERDLSHSPTVVSRTMGGVILGTPGYLSPEQARGKEVDKRSDIWSFGCVLYEMLTGKQTFPGDTVSDMVAAILTREADWKDLPPNTPGKIRELLSRCLQKNPKQRLRDIGDARLEIEDVLAGRPSPGAAEPATVKVKSSARFIGAVVASSLVALATAAFWWAGHRGDASPQWVGTHLGGPNVAWQPRISPDGGLLAFRALVDGIDQVAVMRPDSGDWRVLTQDRSHGYLADLSWSHDGTRIYYGRMDDVPRGVFSVSALGGDERLVLEDARSPEALPDGTLLVVRINTNLETQIYHFWPETGRLEPYAAAAAGYDSSLIRSFRDGKEAVFMGRSLNRQPADAKDYIYTLAISSGDRLRLERLARYAARPPLSMDRLEELPDGKLRYWFKTPWRNGANHADFEPLDFIEKLVALIPSPRMHMVRFHGLLGPAAKWRSCIIPNAAAATEQGESPVTAAPTGEDASNSNPTGEKKVPDTPKAPGRNYSWCELMKRVFVADVLACAHCGGRLRIVTAIRPPEITRKILDHLGLPSRPPPAAGAVHPEIPFAFE